MKAQSPAVTVIHASADSPESLYVGGEIQERKDVVATANPITFVTAKSPPFFIAHGDADALLRGTSEARGDGGEINALE